MSMHVEPATPSDLPAIRAAYAHGRTLQRENGSPLWPDFPDSAILAEISSGALYRVINGDALVGVFSAVYEDAALWGERERHAHIYLHRIARASTYPGRGLVDALLGWAQARAEELGLDGLRMDTWASNEALIAFYAKRGFDLVGRTRIPNDSPLPHYRGLELALMERPSQLGSFCDVRAWQFEVALIPPHTHARRRSLPLEPNPTRRPARQQLLPLLLPRRRESVPPRERNQHHRDRPRRAQIRHRIRLREQH